MGRYLKGNLTTETPSNLIFFDTETWQERRHGRYGSTVHKLRLWCATKLRLEDGRTTRRHEAVGFTQDSFWGFVQQHSDVERTTWLVAHNLTFDVTQLGFWARMDCGDFTILRSVSRRNVDEKGTLKSRMGTMCLENRPIYLRLFSRDKSFVFVDSGNYWPTKLAEIGKSHGVEKGELPTLVNSESHWIDYCKRDVAILEIAFTNLVNKWRADDAGIFAPTSAGLSMNNFRHTCDIRVPDCDELDIVSQPNEKQCGLERESYFGGRFQCFYVGTVKQRVFKIDCNSLYPYVMRTHSFPRRFINYERNVSHATATAATEVYGTVARIKINSRGNSYPCRVDGEQYHCTGTFFASIAGPEFSRALRAGDVSSIQLLQRYSVAPIFREWVDRWYARKVRASKHFDNDPGEYEYCKLVLNSMSGKWAQRGRKWVDLPGEYPIVRWGSYTHRHPRSVSVFNRRGIAGNCQQQMDGSDPGHYFPLISSYITSYAREYMQEVIESAGNDNVYYMATDSLILNRDGMDNLERAGYLHEWELGKFKLEDDADGCTIKGPNYYTMGSKSVVAGPYANARAAWNGAMETDLWEQIGSVIADGPRNDIIVSTVPIRTPVANNKGIIGTDGRWKPYWITYEPAMTDHIKRSQYYYLDVSDTGEVHIRPDV